MAQHLKRNFNLMHTKLDHALYMASLGLKVFPLPADDKRPPLIDSWNAKATADPDGARKFWTDPVMGWEQSHNIGVTGVTVIDVDNKNGLDGSASLAVLQDLYGDLPMTLTVKTTTGGFHLYFQPDPLIGNSASSIASGIDVRGAKTGYVAGPGSTIGDKTYEFVGDVRTIATLPEAWAVLARKAKPNKAKSQAGRGGRVDDGVELDTPTAVHLAAEYLKSVGHGAQGSRNDLGYKMAAKIKDFGISQEKNMELMAEIWNPGNNPPLDEGELADVVAHAYRYGQEKVGSSSPEKDFPPIDEESKTKGMFDDDEEKRPSLEELLVRVGGPPETAETVPHVVEMWLPQGEVSMLGGHGGSGKSYVSLVLAAHTALGLPFGSLRTTQTKVLYVSCEDNARILRLRLARICKAMGVSADDLEGKLILLDLSDIDPVLYKEKRGSSGAPTQLLNDLRAFSPCHDVGFVIVDNASDAFDGDEIRRSQVRAFIRSLRTCLARPDQGVLLLCHLSKAGAASKRGEDMDAYSGSTAWHNSTKSRLMLMADGKDGMVVFHHKANYGPKSGPVKLRWKDGCPMPLTEFEAAEDAKAEEDAEWQSDVEAKDRVVEMIAECEAKGVQVPAASKGPNTTFAMLSERPRFPLGVDSKKLATLLAELKSEKRVFQRSVKTSNRNSREILSTKNIETTDAATDAAR